MCLQELKKILTTAQQLLEDPLVRTTIESFRLQLFDTDGECQLNVVQIQNLTDVFGTVPIYLLPGITVIYLALIWVSAFARCANLLCVFSIYLFLCEVINEKLLERYVSKRPLLASCCIQDSTEVMGSWMLQLHYRLFATFEPCTCTKEADARSVTDVVRPAVTLSAFLSCRLSSMQRFQQSEILSANSVAQISHRVIT